jgi:hypothetical protein
MPHEYTRQRQGRDFYLRSYLTNAADASRINKKNIKRLMKQRKRLRNALNITKPKRNAAPSRQTVTNRPNKGCGRYGF